MTMVWLQTFLCALSFLFVANSKGVPVTFSSKCKLQDSACLKKTAQDFIPTFTDGIPEIGLEVMDPLRIDNVDSTIAGLNFKTKNIVITGFRNTKLEEIEVDKDIKSLSLRILVDLDYTSDYEISGNLILLPIEGKGVMTAKIPKAEVVPTVDIYRKTENGRTYFMVKYREHSYSLKGQSKVKLANLFNGNKELAAAANEMVDQNGNEIISTIGDPIIRAVIDEIVKRINELLKAFEADELYIH